MREFYRNSGVIYLHVRLKSEAPIEGQELPMEMDVVGLKLMNLKNQLHYHNPEHSASVQDCDKVADNLEKIYFFIISQLSKSIRSEEPLSYWDSVLKVLAPLVEGWQKLAEKK